MITAVMIALLAGHHQDESGVRGMRIHRAGDIAVAPRGPGRETAGNAADRYDLRLTAEFYEKLNRTLASADQAASPREDARRDAASSAAR